MKKDQVIGIILFLIGVIVIIMTMQIPNPQTQTLDPGPRLFPSFGGYLLVICGIGTFLTSKGKKETAKPIFTPEGWKRIGSLFVLIIIFAVALTLIGFLIATPIMLFILLKVLSADKKISNVTGVVFSIAVTFTVYFVFEKMLSVMLPSGNIF